MMNESPDNPPLDRRRRMKETMLEVCHRLGSVEDLLPRADAPEAAPPEQLAAVAEALISIAETVESIGLRDVGEVCRRTRLLLDPPGTPTASDLEAAAAALDYLRSAAKAHTLALEGRAGGEGAAEALRQTLATLRDRLPRIASPASEASEDSSAGRAASLDDPLHILVVDDEEIIRLYLCDLLEDLGHRVSSAEDGAAAIRAVEGGFYDLILTDIKMPGADGIEVLRIARELHPDTEVVILTGFASVENAAAAVHYGAYDYLTKPFERTEVLRTLVERVSRTIRLRRENRRLMVELRLRNLELKRYVRSLEEAFETVEEKQRALVHADRMSSLGVLAAGVAHEINNPTTFIRGNLQTLQKFWGILSPALESAAACDCPGVPADKVSFVREETPGLIRDMLTGTDRITRIVAGLRAFAHPEAAVEREPTDLHACIEDAISLVEANKPDGVRIVRDYAEALPPVRAAPHQMTQVFVNLLLNAMQAMDAQEEGVLAIASEAGDDAVRITVSDTGAGMPEEVRNRVFDPFFTTKPVDKGTGLGLSILLGIVGDHGGNVDVESAPGRGSAFTVSLPAMREAPEPEGRPVRVLVVDDDPEYVRFLRNAFEERGGYEVETAGGGFQAVYVIGERRPDVLLLDIRMPDLDGFDVLQALKDSHDLKAIHVIAFTGLEGDSVRQRMGAYSVDAFFRKPIDMEALFAEIETTFGDAAATG